MFVQSAATVRYLLLLLPIVLLATVSPGPSAGARAATSASTVPLAQTNGAAAAVIQGDADCSTVVDLADVVHLLKVQSDTSAGDGCAASAGDVDCVHGTTLVDALWILRYLAGVSLATPANCSAINAEVTSFPSTEELIDAAVTAGEIDAETGLVYKVFAEFGDNRLPTQYAGSGTRGSDTIEEVTLGFDQLSAANQALMQPFLLTPAAPGSWLNLPTVAGAAEGTSAVESTEPITWTTYPAIGGKVKVWAEDRYDGDAAKAQAIAAAMTDKIWGQVTGYFGKTPITDAGLPNNGGDDALDLYLVHIGDNGLARGYSSLCKQYPVFVLLNSTRPLGSETEEGMLQDTVHEFTHAVTNAFPLAAECKAPEYSWFSEATSMWAEDHVYPNAQSEQLYAHRFFDVPEISLDVIGNSHQYGAYIFPYYLTHANLSTTVALAWQAFATRTSLAGVEFAMSGTGGFEETWPEFANYNWNQDPVDYYFQLDKLENHAYSSSDPIEQGIGKYPINFELAYLTANYFHFVFQPDVRNVVFKNTLADPGPPSPHAHVWGIEKINGEWNDPVDWTGESEKKWCRDTPDQNIEELVLVFSNSDWAGKSTLTSAESPTVEGKALGCPGWSGTMTATQTWSNAGGYGTATSTFTGKWVLVDPNAPVVPCQSLGDPPENPDPCLLYRPEGTISWTWEAHVFGDPGCDATSSGSLPATEPLSGVPQVFYLQPLGDGVEIKYYGTGAYQIPAQGCYNTITDSRQPPAFFDISQNADVGNPPDQAGTECYHMTWRLNYLNNETIEGSCDRYDYGYHAIRDDWHLTRVGNAIPASSR